MPKNIWFRRVLWTVVGAAGGYAYYATIGCASGGCPLTSNPYTSMAWGSAVALAAGWGTGKTT